ncbi:MAG: DUF4974 domain-containing protein [Bacteroidales bacterium]|nr:DUF4974 domain-containing protein [Bacteroidales bacterium]
MQDKLDKNLDFVVKNYKEDSFDTEQALRKFHKRVGDSRQSRTSRRWWAAAAAVFAGAFVLFAGGYGIYNMVQKEPAPAPEVRLQQETPAEVHTFVFDNTPLADVLEELSDYYNCTLTAPVTNKRLTGSFPEDNLEEIVVAIENALDVDITIGK